MLSARLLNRGHAFDTIFYDQFALLPQYIAMAFRIGGDNLLSARLAILLSAAFGLTGLAALARRLSGRVAAVAVIPLTILHAHYLMVARYTIGEAPALACAIWALVLVVLYRASRRRVWLGIASALFCAAVLFKPMVIGLMPALAILVLSVHTTRASRGLRVKWRALGIDLVLSVTIALGIAAPFVGLTDLAGEFERTAGFHFTQSPAYAESFDTHLDALWAWLYTSRAWLGLAALGLVMCLRAQTLLSLALVIGELGMVWLLLLLPPFPHHYALLVPALTLFAACGLQEGVTALGQRARGARTNRRASLTAISLALIFIGALSWSVLKFDSIVSDTAHVFAERWIDRRALVTYLRRNTLPDAYVLSDDPKVIYLADRQVPPSAVLLLYDTTFDVLPDALARFQNSAAQYNVQAVVVTGAYRRHAALLHWIEQAYPRSIARGDAERSMYGIIYQPAP